MGKWIEQRPYRLYFSERGISFYNGNGLVSHKQVKKDETEVEVAEKMVDTYLHDKAYREWLKIVKIVYQVNKSITKMMNDELWIEFLKSDDAKLLTQLKKDVIDTSLTELWGELK